MVIFFGILLEKYAVMYIEMQRIVLAIIKTLTRIALFPHLFFDQFAMTYFRQATEYRNKNGKYN